MAESLDFDDVGLPCEFCTDLFPVDDLLEHQNLCKFRYDDVEDEHFSSLKDNQAVAVKMEQTIIKDVFTIQTKNDGGSVLLKWTNLDVTDNGNLANDETIKICPAKDVTNKGNLANDETNKDKDQDIHCTNNAEKQVQQSSSTNSVEDMGELSDDNNDEGITVESCLQKFFEKYGKMKSKISNTKDHNCNVFDSDSEEEEEEIIFQCGQHESVPCNY